MSDEGKTIKIRVKTGESEAEVEATLANIRSAIDMIPEVLAKLPRSSGERVVQSFRAREEMEAPRPSDHQSVASAAPLPTAMPTVTIEKGDSLSDVISRFFADSWGRNPRKLMEVREALQSYGLNYPKQSVAVALLRLAKGSRIRRFKGEGGEYVYTASTGGARIPTAGQSSGVQHSADETIPAVEAGTEPEEQLNLDAPKTG